MFNPLANVWDALKTQSFLLQRLTMIDSRAGTEPMHLVLNEEDLPYEEEILRNPHSIKPWIRYIGQICDEKVFFA